MAVETWAVESSVRYGVKILLDGPWPHAVDLSDDLPVEALYSVVISELTVWLCRSVN